MGNERTALANREAASLSASSQQFDRTPIDSISITVSGMSGSPLVTSTVRHSFPASASISKSPATRP